MRKVLLYLQNIIKELQSFGCNAHDAPEVGFCNDLFKIGVRLETVHVLDRHAVQKLVLILQSKQ